jgi:membrane protein DedA with SNARE-associated domain
MESWLEFAFYPVLLIVLVTASLGVPIPEDLPLIAAGVILRLHPETASLTGTFVVSLVGIICGDIILYGLGRRWGRGVFQHRSIRWLITPRRLAAVSQHFRRYGTWVCFFGRFVLGVRAAMCITAGVTRFPFWRFLLADLGGAVLSIPLFLGLGYLFAPMLGTLHQYVFQAQRALLLLVATGLTMLIVHEYRRHAYRRSARTDRAAPAVPPVPAALPAGAAAPKAARRGRTYDHACS